MRQDIIDTTGTVNYEVSADGTVGPGASFDTLRYTGGSGSVTRTNIMGDFTANGLMNATNSNCWISGNVTVGSSKELVLTGGTNGGTLFTFVGTFTGASDTVITIAATNTQILGFGNTTDGAQFGKFLRHGQTLAIPPIHSNLEMTLALRPTKAWEMPLLDLSAADALHAV